MHNFTINPTNLGLVLLQSFIASLNTTAQESKSLLNIVMIIVDDEDAEMNGLMHPQAKTPAFDKLSKRSVQFTNAFCAAPACGPSRTSLMTGAAPYRTGAYYNNQNLWATPNLYSDVDNLPGFLKKNGYLTAGIGKVYHTPHDELTKNNWTDGFYVPYNTTKNTNMRNQTSWSVKVFEDLWSFGPLPDTWDLNDTSLMQQDTKDANMVIEMLSQKQQKPFFITLGSYKPHVPYFVAQRYFDMYPPDSIKIPESYLEGDLDDVPECARQLATHRGFHKYIVDNNLWKKVLQAEMASVTYADEQIGRVLDALEKSRYRDNTVVVFIGDNGFHSGEKEHWTKFALWEKAAKVPMLISMPKQHSKSVINSPVSLLDIYPTVLDLCGIEPPKTHKLDGISLKSILHGKTTERGQPVVVTHGANNHAVITADYHYIRYRNGAEELYDKKADRYQWYNIANKPEMKSAIEQLKQYLPTDEAENIPFEYGGEESKGWDNKWN